MKPNRISQILIPFFGLLLLIHCSGRADETKEPMPEEPLVVESVSEVYHVLAEGNIKLAIAMMEQLLEEKTGHYTEFLLLAKLYQRNGDYAKSIVLFEQLASQFTSEPYLHWELSIAYFRFGLVSVALEHFHLYLSFFMSTVHQSKIS